MQIQKTLKSIVVPDKLNAQRKGWCPTDKAIYEGTKIDGIKCQFGLEQLIHEIAHITGEKSSWVDLDKLNKFSGGIRTQ